jgi:hypothetical protein
MTPDDATRAAAERLRQHRAVVTAMRHPKESPYTYIEVSTGAAGFVPEAELKDMATVVTAYLAANPADDGKPVTRVWLQSRRFRPEPTNEFEGGPVNVWVLRDEHGEPVLTLDCIDSKPNEWDAFFGAIEDWNQFPRSIATRGDVRRLLAALGIA